MQDYSQGQEEAPRIPTAEEEALAEAIEARIPLLKQINDRLSDAHTQLALAMRDIAVLNAEIAGEAFALVSPEQELETMSWLANALQKLGEASLHIPSLAVNAERTIQNFTTMTRLIREVGRCEACGGFHGQYSVHVIDIAEHLRGKGGGWASIFQANPNADPPSQN